MVLTMHCEATAGSTFAPLAKAVRAFLHIPDGDGGDNLRAAIASWLMKKVSSGVAGVPVSSVAIPPAMRSHSSSDRPR